MSFLVEVALRCHMPWLYIELRDLAVVNYWKLERKGPPKMKAIQILNFLWKKNHQWHLVAWLYGQLRYFHSCFFLRFHCSKKSSVTWTVSLFILSACLFSGHVAQPTHLSQLASTSSLFPLKQEAGDEKVSHICKMQPPALLIASFSLERNDRQNFLFLLPVTALM